MSTSNPIADLVLKVLQGLLAFVSSLSPVNIDNDMPDLDVSLWRFSLHDYEIELTKRGQSTVEEVYCRVRVWIPVNGGSLYPLDYERWVSDTQFSKPRAIPHDEIPSELLRSPSPNPGPSKIENLHWIAVISRRKEVVSRTGAFQGRVAYSDEAVSLCLQLRFFCTLAATRVLPILLRLLFSAAIVLGLILLLICPAFRGWIARFLQVLWEAWLDLSQPGASPVATPTPPY